MMMMRIILLARFISAETLLAMSVRALLICLRRLPRFLNMLSKRARSLILPIHAGKSKQSMARAISVTTSFLLRAILSLSGLVLFTCQMMISVSSNQCGKETGRHLLGQVKM